MQNAAMAQTSADDRTAPESADRVTISLTPQGRRAVAQLTARRGRTISQNVDAALSLLARVHREIGDGDDGSSLAIRRADGTVELLHVV